MDSALISGLLNAEGARLPADMKKMTERYLSHDGHSAVFEVKLDQYGSSDESRETAKQLRDTILPNSICLKERLSVSAAKRWRVWIFLKQSKIA